jgi:hypothetical protein
LLFLDRSWPVLVKTFEDLQQFRNGLCRRSGLAIEPTRTCCVQKCRTLE